MTFGLLWLDDFVNCSLKSSLINVERCVSMDINTILDVKKKVQADESALMKANLLLKGVVINTQLLR